MQKKEGMPMAIEIDRVQQTTHGYSINFKVTASRWMTLEYSTEAEAQEARDLLVRAVEKAVAGTLPASAAPVVWTSDTLSARTTPTAVKSSR
jgi:hypothetical protein